MTADSKEHLTEEEIALFVEESYEEVDKVRVSSHLQSCERCFAEYKNAVRWRGILKSDPNAFKSSKDLIDTGMNLAPNSGRVIKPKEPGRFWEGKRLVAAAALVVLLAGVLWISSTNREENLELPAQLTDPISAAAQLASTRSLIVLPGSEHSFDGNAPTYRSGSSVQNESISSSLLQLVELYDKETNSRVVLRWLITGFLATGQLTPARTYTQKALDLFPDDGEINLLAGLVAYLEGEPDESERYLRVALEVEPDNSVAMLNLGLVLKENGESSEARRFLDRVTKDHPGTPLALRAERILETAPPR